MPALLSFSEVQTTRVTKRIVAIRLFILHRAPATGSVRSYGKVMRMRIAPSAREEDPTLAYRYCILLYIGVAHPRSVQ